MTRGAKPNPDTNRAQIRLDPELKAEAFALCHAENKSLSLVMRDLLEEWVEQTRSKVACDPRKKRKLRDYKAKAKAKTTKP